MPANTAGQVSVTRARDLIRGGVLAAAACFAVAAGGVTAGHSADIELGRYLSSECMTCHGTAKADSTTPYIFGLGEKHFVEVIRAYRDKALPNPVMQTIAGRLNDDDIAALALFRNCQEMR
jgi:cytochrome c